MSALPPDKIVVGPHTYNLHFAEDLQATEHYHSSDVAADKGSDENMFGYLNHKTGDIYVGLDQNGSQQRDTLIHETMHVILMQLAHDDEYLVHRIAPALLGFMQANPKWVEFVMARRFR